MKRLLLYILPAVLAVPAVLIGRSLVQSAGQQRTSRKAPVRRPRERKMVYITDFGTRYHTAGCRALAHSKTAHRVAIDELPEQYEPCHECNPPVPARTSVDN